MKEELMKRWQPIIAQWQVSGLSKTEFCRQNNIDLTLFKYHSIKQHAYCKPRKDVSPEGSTGGNVFAEVVCASAAPKPVVTTKKPATGMKTPLLLQEKWQALNTYAITAGPTCDDLIARAINAGYPVSFGVPLYRSFESDAVAETGLVPMPHPFREQLLGGHAMVADEYDEQYIGVCNSWGTAWGQGGYCKIPRAYFRRYLWDARVISQTELGA